MSPLLPIGLLALLFASPVLSQSAVLITPNDPFHYIAKLVIKSADPPICCLRPLPSSEPTEEIEILSFEDWKAKQSTIASEEHKVSVSGAIPDGTNHEPNTDGALVYHDHSTQDTFDQLSSPHFRVPITDRFNYASTDCSARVHASHKGAKSPYAILDSKKDRYMLSPCRSQERQFIVVELCDDIRIDTVQLANFEFFSGVFKEFNVSVARTYTLDPNEWKFAGSYTAKNIRGVQSFHPPTYLRDFYRVIRIEFISHYGSEYYCPISLLRVYGLTHLEQWKWDEWEAESRAKMITQGEVVRLINASEEQEKQETKGQKHPEVNASNADGLDTNAPMGHTENAPQELDNSVHPGSSTTLVTTTFLSMTRTDEDTVSNVATEVVNSSSSSAMDGNNSAIADVDSNVTNTQSQHSISSPKSIAQDAADSLSSNLIDPNQAISSNATVEDKITFSSLQSAVSTPANAFNVSSAEIESSSSTSTSDFIQSSVSPSSSSIATPTSSVATTTIVNVVQTHPIGPSIPSSGESIYRTIMNRLSGLEANSSLYMRYVEEQTRSIREALRRLEEDVGRSESLAKTQAQFFQRTIQEWDKQRVRLEQDYIQLLSRVNYLSDEVTLEKRLGIAQLLLLLTVLIFMSLTRGSRDGSFWDIIASPKTDLQSTNRRGGRKNSLKEWGRQRLRNFSLLSLRSNSPTLVQSSEEKVVFPTATNEVAPSESNVHGTSTPKRRSTASNRPRTAGVPRTPVGRHFNVHRPSTPTSTSAPYRTSSSLQNLNIQPRSSASNLPFPFSASSSAGVIGGGTSARPGLRRTNSQSTSTALVGPVPRSARKWAKSAHLHEMRSPSSSRHNSHKPNEGSATIPSDIVLLDETELVKDEKLPALASEIPSSSTMASASPTRVPFTSLQNTPSNAAENAWRPSTSRQQSAETDVGGDTESWVDTDADIDGDDVGPDFDVDLLGI